MAQTIVIKLVTGDEWIAQRTITLDNSTQYVLSKVRHLKMMADRNGRPALTLAPICLGNVEQDELVLDSRFVVFSMPVDPNLERQYLQEVTGIQLA